MVLNGVGVRIDFVLPQGYLAISGSIFGCHNWGWVILASSGYSPGMWLIILQYTGQPPTEKKEFSNPIQQQ